MIQISFRNVFDHVQSFRDQEASKDKATESRLNDEVRKGFPANLFK